MGTSHHLVSHLSKRCIMCSDRKHFPSDVVIDRDSFHPESLFQVFILGPEVGVNMCTAVSIGSLQDNVPSLDLDRSPIFLAQIDDLSIPPFGERNELLHPSVIKFWLKDRGAVPVATYRKISKSIPYVPYSTTIWCCHS